MSTWNDVETKQGKDYSVEVPPPGAIPARICALLDVGSHDCRSQKGEVYPRRFIIIGYELDEKTEDGGNFFAARAYTLSLDTKANFYAIVKAVHGELKLGQQFSPDMLAGKPCQLQISHETKERRGKMRTYANIDAVLAIGRGQTVPPGGCVVWRINDYGRVLMPDVSFLPPLWHEDTGKMLTAPEWAALAHEVRGTFQNPGQAPAADARMPANGAVVQPARDVTPAPRPVVRAASAPEVYGDDSDIPF